ncbi:hypothetical protein HN011_006499 [Eciton burchellii]|nr:hypothetical protein HN011_006499 [Eciton burchellii]
MEFLGYRYYKLNRFLLLPLGLWPCGDSCLKQVQAIFWIVMLTSVIVTQLIKLFIMEYDLELILTNLSYAIPSVIYLLKYNTFYIQSQKIKKIMEQIQDDWNALSDDQEIKIMERFAKSGRMYIYVFVGIVYPAAVAFIAVSLLPDILDAVAPLNESRIRMLPFMAEYFLDQETYFYPLLFHMDLSLIAGITTAIATETLLFAYVYHICAMFQITSYRIWDTLGDTSMLFTPNRENAICVKLIDAIRIHQKAIEFFEHIESTFGLSYFILIILGVASLSINLFRLFQVAVLPNQRKEFALFAIFVFSHFYYMFVCNYIGQKLIDNSTVIHARLYDTRWYLTPVQTQRLLLLVMQKSMRSCKLVMGGIYTVSLENFTTLASMSLSYFTVIYSMQQ